MDKATYDKGLRMRRETLGDSYVDKALAEADDFTQDLQQLVTTFCWGEVWGRKGLDRKTRSTNNLAMDHQAMWEREPLMNVISTDQAAGTIIVRLPPQYPLKSIMSVRMLSLRYRST
jgi:hypothetical protein